MNIYPQASFAYKVLRNVNRELKSLYVSDHVRYCLSYPLNQWICPKIGKIFAFDTYTNALAYHSIYKICHGKVSSIYLALISDCEKPEVISAYQSSMFIELAWKNTLSSYYYMQAPEGTILSSQIKLVKKLL